MPQTPPTSNKASSRSLPGSWRRFPTTYPRRHIDQRSPSLRKRPKKSVLRCSYARHPGQGIVTSNTDTCEYERRLCRLVDFERLSHAATRLSLNVSMSGRRCMRCKTLAVASSGLERCICAVVRPNVQAEHSYPATSRRQTILAKRVLFRQCVSTCTRVKSNHTSPTIERQ